MDMNQIIYDSFYQLVIEKGVAQTTVADILNRSGVSRTTFYRHFQDKYELMSYGIKHFIDDQHYRPGKES